MAKYVKWKGGLSWNFDPLFTMPIDPEFEQLINTYLEDVFRDKSAYKGWKIPETTLVYPWILRMFPDIKYIHWIRDPRDCILGSHKTDNLRDFGIEYEHTDDVFRKARNIMVLSIPVDEATPRPKHIIQIRFEDFVLKQELTLKKLEEFLGLPLGRIIVRPEAVERWKRVDQPCKLPFDFLQEAIVENGYSLSSNVGASSESGLNQAIIGNRNSCLHIQNV